jgi:gamma-glutamylputrescine oxidase
MPASPSPPSLWQAQHRWAGFSRLEGPALADVVIVGAGVTGAACALELARSGASVIVVEGDRAGAGASGRNGGFASAGTGLELAEAEARIGPGPARALRRATQDALDAMLALAAERGEPDAVRRTGSLWVAGPDEADRLEAAVTALRAGGVDCREAPERIPEPMRPYYARAALFPGDCELQPARWVRALAEAAASAGARFHESSPAVAVEPRPDGWRVRTPAGTAAASAVVVACDGLIPRLVPELRGIVYPVRGQMLATAPLPTPVIVRPTHCDHGFVYARPTLDGRLAIGGARWADLEAEYTDDARPTEPVQAALERFLADRLGLAGVGITHRWAGTMGFSADLLPVAGELPGRPGLHVAGGYSGVGNVQGFVCGGMLAAGLAGRRHPLADALAPARFAVDGVLGPPTRLREREESRRLRAVLAARQPETGAPQLAQKASPGLSG